MALYQDQRQGAAAIRQTSGDPSAVPFHPFRPQAPGARVQHLANGSILTTLPNGRQIQQAPGMKPYVVRAGPAPQLLSPASIHYRPPSAAALPAPHPFPQPGYAAREGAQAPPMHPLTYAMIQRNML